MKAGEMQTEGNNRAVTNIQVARHMKLVGGVPNGKGTSS